MALPIGYLSLGTLEQTCRSIRTSVATVSQAGDRNTSHIFRTDGSHGAHRATARAVHSHGGYPVSAALEHAGNRISATVWASSLTIAGRP
jgi:hypothetical protein